MWIRGRGCGNHERGTCAELQGLLGKAGCRALWLGRRVESDTLAKKLILIKGVSWEGNASSSEWTCINQLTLERQPTLVEHL